MKNKKLNISIIGASGYTGIELIRILYNHPNVVIKSLIAEKNAGKPIDAIYPHFIGFNLPDLISLSDENFNNIDVVFCCLPHATSQKIISNLPQNLKIIDLSADFRIKDINIYEKWYGNKHIAPDLQKLATYGLTEIYHDDIKNSRLVACPGCYPTSAQLPLYPLIKNKLLSTENIIIDSKSGTSGAGRSIALGNLFCEVNESVKAYKICDHRHMPEIEQTLSQASGNNVKVTFTPHLVPMNRGIISTIYANTTKNSNINNIREELKSFYKDSIFINIADEGIFPSTKDVYGTNKCIISLTSGRLPGQIIIISVIDNLVKGSSGQAVQNMNIMFDLDEATGLESIPIFP